MPDKALPRPGGYDLGQVERHGRVDDRELDLLEGRGPNHVDALAVGLHRIGVHPDDLRHVGQRHGLGAPRGGQGPVLQRTEAVEALGAGGTKAAQGQRRGCRAWHGGRRAEPIDQADDGLELHCADGGVLSAQRPQSARHAGLPPGRVDLQREWNVGSRDDAVVIGEVHDGLVAVVVEVVTLHPLRCRGFHRRLDGMDGVRRRGTVLRGDDDAEGGGHRGGEATGGGVLQGLGAGGRGVRQGGPVERHGGHGNGVHSRGNSSSEVNRLDVWR